MRLTVGPLPPAVYWRRRAVVLGAMLLFLIVLLYSCIGTDGAGKDKTATPGQTTPPGSSLTPTVDPSASGGAEPGTPEPTGPGGEPSDAPGGDDEGTAVEPAGGGQVPAPAPPVENECADQEMSVIPVPSQTSAQRGEPIELRLKIKNISGRTCMRNVGAAVQELYVKAGARVVWSSDVCSTARDNEVLPFPPTHEKEYTIVWNGRESAKCGSGGVAAGDYPVAGTYQLFGRLGDKHSAPVRITITG